MKAIGAEDAQEVAHVDLDHAHDLAFTAALGEDCLIKAMLGTAQSKKPIKHFAHRSSEHQQVQICSNTPCKVVASSAGSD